MMTRGIGAPTMARESAQKDESAQKEECMSDTETELGPVDYLIVEWPAGTQPNGEGLKELANLTDRGLIRVLDLVFVAKGEDGTVAGLALADIDADGDLDLLEFEGASYGLLG